MRRSSPRGSSATLAIVSKIIVRRRFRSNAGHSGIVRVFGFPVRANARRASLMQSATRCDSGVAPTMCGASGALSNTRGTSRP